MHPPPFSPSRRVWLLGGSALAGLSAAGCFSVPPLPQIAAGSCSAVLTPFLAAAEVQAAWARPERNFDAHTHFFNARDVPVAGFLAKSGAHSIPSDALRQLVIALAPVAEAHGQPGADA